jgi:VWFA-related protein
MAHGGSPPCRGTGWHGAVVLPVLAMIVSAALVRAIETDSAPAAAPPSLVPVSAGGMSVTAAEPMPTIASTRTAIESSSGRPASERRVTDVPAGRPHEPPPLPAAVVAHVESSAGTARPSSRELQQPDAGRVPGRRLVFAFDPTSLGPDEFDASRRAALRFVDGQMADGDLIAIVWVAASVDTVVDFTSDRETLRATLQSLAPPAPAAPGTDAPLLGLSTVCDAVAAIPGRKSVLFLTSGARLEPLDLTELRQTTRACSRANVALYPLDARGLRDMPDPVGTTDVFR